MTYDVIELGFEQWISDFGPLPNPVSSNRGFDIGDGFCLFETFGEDLNHIRGVEPSRVWTLLETDGVMHIANGVRFVNRLGYFVTERSWLSGSIYEVSCYD